MGQTDTQAVIGENLNLDCSRSRPKSWTLNDIFGPTLYLKRPLKSRWGSQSWSYIQTYSRTATWLSSMYSVQSLATYNYHCTCNQTWINTGLPLSFNYWVQWWRITTCTTTPILNSTRIQALQARLSLVEPDLMHTPGPGRCSLCVAIMCKPLKTVYMHHDCWTTTYRRWGSLNIWTGGVHNSVKNPWQTIIIPLMYATTCKGEVWWLWHNFNLWPMLECGYDQSDSLR